MLAARAAPERALVAAQVAPGRTEIALVAAQIALVVADLPTIGLIGVLVRTELRQVLLELAHVSARQVLAQRAAVLRERLAGATELGSRRQKRLAILTERLLIAMDGGLIAMQLVMRVGVVRAAHGFRPARVVCGG